MPITFGGKIRFCLCRGHIKRLYILKCLSVSLSVHLSVIETPQQLEIIILHLSFFILPYSSFILPSFILHSFLHFVTFRLFSLFNCTGRNCIITSLVWPRNFYTGIKISDSACLDLYFAKPNMIKKKINYSLILDLLQITFYFTLMKHCGNMLLFHIV